ncbi:MAG: transglutaminase-like domain-containing protein [Pseudomonadota bacterium]
MSRVFAITFGLALIVVTFLTLQHQQPPTLKVATKLLGETWYRIELQDDHVGFMHNYATTDLEGRFHFTTTTHFRLHPGAPTSISKTLEFSSEHGYPLNRARYVNREHDQLISVSIQREGSTYMATIENGAHTTQQNLDWQFSLNDFVALETWLESKRPAPGAVKLAKNPDFERLTISQQGFRVAAVNPEGYLLENDAPLAAHQIQLDHNYRPANLFMSGTFNFVATDQVDAIDLDQATSVTNYHFAADSRIANHTDVTRLKLSLVSKDLPELPSTIEIRAGQASQLGEPGAFLGLALRYPIELAEIKRIVANQKARAADDRELAENLARAVYQRLQYRANSPAGSVVEALRTGGGECADFADLLTTLARAADIPARTVYGLVYKDGSNPGFVFHAWNELFFDGAWVGMDPTWNQAQIDATHLVLTDAQAGAIMLAVSRDDISIAIQELDYSS